MDYSKTDIVIYHEFCPDGLAAGWCFWSKFDNAKILFHGGRYGDSPPDVTDKNVVIVDFSYPKKIIMEMLEKAKSLIILDHHESAKPLISIVNNKFKIILDMDRSGAQIAYDEIYNNERPWFIDDIADRDLWKWKIENSKNTTRAMYEEGHYKNFEKFNGLIGKNRNDFISLGDVLNKLDQKIHNMITSKAVLCTATSLKDSNKKWNVMLVECLPEYRSEIGSILCKNQNCDFAAMWRYDIVKDEWNISCRAAKNDINLTTIVTEFDDLGGGHKSASGFGIYGCNGHNLKSIFVPIISN